MPEPPRSSRAWLRTIKERSPGLLRGSLLIRRDRRPRLRACGRLRAAARLLLIAARLAFEAALLHRGAARTLLGAALHSLRAAAELLVRDAASALGLAARE